jgi:hypothetical protein
MNGPPTVQEIRDWLRLSDSIDDIALEDGLRAAVEHQQRTLRFPESGYTDDLRFACMLRVARYLARRNSPEGIVGVGDFGGIQIASSDRDIYLLESAHIKQVIA